MLRKTILSILSLLAVSAVTAQTPHRYVLDVKEFNELNVVDGINVNYRCSADSAGTAVFDAEPRMASALIFKNNGKGQLSMQLSVEGIESPVIPTVTVYSTYLAKAVNSGDSTVRIETLAPLPKMTFNLVGNGRLVVHDINTTKLEASLKTGNGTMVLFGKCDEANIKFYGTGLIQADDLAAQELTIKAAGTGSIGCNPVRKLNLYGMGSSTIYYLGNPEIKNKSVGLKVLPMDNR